ncbi:MAG TPA: hypothetical protein ENK76_04435 [Campylobacterales bacterium]|nr:hypothetical protein [Campylobacterales bacterium]
MTFENSDDYISAIFNTDLINKHTEYLVGVGIGIADINQKIPVAKKVIFTKDKIEDVDELYLLLNETELISAKENSYTLKYNDNNFDLIHLEKYIKKISRINLLFEKLSKQKKYNSFYEQLAFKEFSATNNIFGKLKENHPYYVNYRKRVLDILIKSYAHEQYNSIYMVMPIYQEDNIFAHLSSKALVLQEDLKALSSKVDIEIVFVIENCQNSFGHEFREFLSKVQNQIKIYFAFKNQIENEVNSIDFLFTDKNNFVVSKFLRVNNPVFNIFQEQFTVEEHEAMYRKILNRSMSYSQFMEDKNQLCNSVNPLLKTLSGEWYLYVYGSRKLWEDKVVIFDDGKVDFYSDNQKTDSGIIINKEYQSIILLDDIVSRRLLTILFDHQPYKIQKAFTIKVISKQYNNDFDILTIGLFSRKPIEMMKVYEILGDIDDVRILEDSRMNDNLANYLIDEYGYYYSHE